MRQIISISLPKQTAQYVKQQMQRSGFRSQSEYFRHLIDLEAGMISEDDVLNYAKNAKRAHQAGNTTKLSSLADLM